MVDWGLLLGVALLRMYDCVSLKLEPAQFRLDCATLSLRVAGYLANRATLALGWQDSP